MDVICQCGKVTFTTPLPKPLALYICHCMECKRKASASLNSSAIYPRFPLPVSPALSFYKRPTASGETLLCYFCKECGTRLIHITPSKNVVSVKAGCIIGLDWSTAVHLSTLCAMLPISEGSEATVQSPQRTLSPGASLATSSVDGQSVDSRVTGSPKAGGDLSTVPE